MPNIADVKNENWERAFNLEIWSLSLEISVKSFGDTVNAETDNKDFKMCSDRAELANIYTTFEKYGDKEKEKFR